MFGLTIVNGILIAKSPIFHGGNEKTGSVQLLNRIKFIVDGKPMEIPYISGNSVRGYLRRLVFQDFLHQVGYEIDVSKKQGQYLWHTLFSGGLLETVEEKNIGVIDIEFKKKVYTYIVPARLWGFAFQNQMIEGKLKVGHILPICRELKDYLPDNIEPKNSFYQLITHIFQTRRDELRTEREKEEQAIQMLIEYEVFSPGTMFYHEFRLEDADILEKAVLNRAISLWKKYPYIGGKSSIGFGELKINYDTSPLTDEKIYLDFLEKERDKIVEVLDSLASKL